MFTDHFDKVDYYYHDPTIFDHDPTICSFFRIIKIYIVQRILCTCKITNHDLIYTYIYVFIVAFEINIHVLKDYFDNYTLFIYLVFENKYLKRVKNQVAAMRVGLHVLLLSYCCRTYFDSAFNKNTEHGELLFICMIVSAK